MRRILAGSAVSFSRRGALIGALALAACGKKGEAEPPPTKAARNMTLQDAVAGDKTGLCGHAGGAADGGRVILAANHEHRP